MASGHKMIRRNLPQDPTLRYDAIVGLVTWASADKWDAALQTVTPFLNLLADAVGPSQSDQ
eukprot:4889618-Pyramimonas_sp.AAC.1